MKYLIILLLLTGCREVPIKPEWPGIPEELSKPCPELTEISTTKMSDLLLTVTNNYSLYHECQLKFSSWIEWYNSQKKIYESIR